MWKRPTNRFRDPCCFWPTSKSCQRIHKRMLKWFDILYCNWSVSWQLRVDELRRTIHPSLVGGLVSRHRPALVAAHWVNGVTLSTNECGQPNVGHIVGQLHQLICWISGVGRSALCCVRPCRHSALRSKWPSTSGTGASSGACQCCMCRRECWCNFGFEWFWGFKVHWFYARDMWYKMSVLDV